jgi:hypothetical protein
LGKCCRTILATGCAIARHLATPALPQDAPYLPSPVIESITWHWDTLKQAAPGSDLWPITWASDGHLYAAWGDGGGFGGTNCDGRVAMGLARIEGSPQAFVAANVNGGKDPEHPSSFPDKGKTGGIVCVDGTLYARLNMQDGEWPDVNHGLIWSRDLGATWETAPWVFPKGDGRFRPTGFVQFGQDYGAVPDHLAGFVYLHGDRQARRGNTFMGRVPRDRLSDRNAYEFIAGFAAHGAPVWGPDVDQVQPIFRDADGGIGSVTYVPSLDRYIGAGYHGGPNQLGVFDAPEPWGPWTTVAYYEDWGNMGPEGHGLTCSFPQKWMSADGLTMWCVFSVYGEGAKQGIKAHDCFNLVKLSVSLRRPADSGSTPSPWTGSR